MSEKHETKAPQTVAMPVDAVAALVGKLMDRLDRYESGDPADMQLERMRANRTPAGWDKPIIKDCLFPDTGVMFDAVLTGRKDALVFDIVNVRMPEGAETWVKYGGLVPDGMAIHPVGAEKTPKVKEDGTSDDVRFSSFDGPYTQEYKTWRYSALIQPTRTRIIGKVLPDYVRPKPKAA